VSALDVSPTLPRDLGSPRDLSSLELVYTAENVDEREAEPAGIDAHK